MSKSALNLSAIAAFVLALVTPTSAQAQAGGAHPTGTSLSPTWEVSAGYQLFHAPDQTNPFGLNVDGARNFGAVGLVADAGWSFDKSDDVTSHLFNIGAGPRWTARSNAVAWPFAQVVAGLVHARVDVDSVTTSATKFMLQPGAGLVLIGGDGWGITGQVDYRRVFLDEDEDGASGENDFRVFVGVRVILD
jgi:hypothetical protein